MSVDTSALFQNRVLKDAWMSAYAQTYPPCDSGIHGVTCNAVPLSLAVTQPGFLTYTALEAEKNRANTFILRGIAQHYNQNVCGGLAGDCSSDNGLPMYYDLLT